MNTSIDNSKTGETGLMKAAVVHSFGESPRYEDFPRPTVGEQEILVQVRAAGLHPIVRARAKGAHYSSQGRLPLVPGLDGIGSLEDGKRVYFVATQPTYGSMAEQSVTRPGMYAELPDGLDDAVAAAIFNPGLAAWLALKWRGQLAQGETVLIMGATGASGQLAVQIAKHLGAGRIIAAGRNQKLLDKLPQLGADTTISLNQSAAQISEAVLREAGDNGIQVVIDYVWGSPIEAVIAAIKNRPYTSAAGNTTRLVQVGNMAGTTITLPADVLRSSGLVISGVGLGTPPIQQLVATAPELAAFVLSKGISIEVEQVQLSEIEAAWQQPNADRERLVVVL